MLGILLVSAALSFADARARALEQNPELATARLLVPEAEAARETAGQLPNPNLTATFGGEDPTASVALDMRLPFLGQRQSAVKAAERMIPVARAQFAQASVHAAAAIRRAYFALAAAQAQLELATQIAEISAQLESATRAKEENGSVSQLEVEQARVTRQRADRAKLEALSVQSDARAELGALLGVPDEELSATDAVDAEVTKPAIDGLFAQQVGHPAIAALEASAVAGDARASAERAQVVPVPDLSLGVEHGQAAPTTSIRVGIAFELPVLSWNRGRVLEAELAAKRARSTSQATAIRLRADLRAAEARFSNARARVQLEKSELVPAAEHLLGLARTAYDLGRAPLLAVISAQQNLVEARAAELTAALELQRALADIEEAVGAQL